MPVIAIAGYVMEGKGVADLESEIDHYRELGIGGMKLKVGKLRVEKDIERARLARKVGVRISTSAHIPTNGGRWMKPCSSRVGCRN